jgi:hypothetical protein
MTSEGTDLVAAYVWDNAMAEARRRLGLLEQTMTRGTVRNLDAVGVTPITLVQAKEKVRFSSEDQAVIDATIAELDDPDRWFPPVGMTAAWGRRPA